MISFFHRNKGKFNVCEDSLTAVVFDTLKYLPSELFWSILKKSLYQDKLPYSCGEILSIEYWQKWNANKTTNSKFVEPDIFIRFNEFDIIIEAKRYNTFQQSDTQIKNEIQAYFNEYEQEDKKLYFIQLGGLYNKNNIENIIEHKTEVVICKTDWTKILDQVVFERNKIKDNDLSFLKSYTRILDDTIIGFELHQFYKKIWLKDLKVKNTINYTSLKKLFSYAK